MRSRSKCLTVVSFALCAGALCLLTACERAGFESLGALAPTPQLEPRDAGSPTMPQAIAGSSASPAPDAAMPSAAGSAGLAAVSGGMGGGASGTDGGAGGNGAPKPLTGMVGTTAFAVKSGFVVENADELGTTNVYLLDSSVTCQQISTRAWLNGLPSSVHVIEIAFASASTPGTTLSTSSISYATGGMYSFTKMRAETSTLMLTQNKPKSVVEGTLMATFSSGSVMGAFHADACASGMSF
jgi:hypothetical protein